MNKKHLSVTLTLLCMMLLASPVMAQQPQQEEVERLFETLDANGDGGIELAEFEVKGLDDVSCWFHTADTNQSGSIDLSELLRVIQLFNIGSLHCESGTEDGYAPGPGPTDCPPHDSDFNPQAWEINLPELLRLIQLFNIGSYGVDCTGSTEDGFIPGGTVTSCGPCSGSEGEGEGEGELTEGEGSLEGEGEGEGEGSAEGEGEGEGEGEQPRSLYLGRTIGTLASHFNSNQTGFAYVRTQFAPSNLNGSPFEFSDEPVPEFSGDNFHNIFVGEGNPSPYGFEMVSILDTWDGVLPVPTISHYQNTDNTGSGVQIIPNVGPTGVVDPVAFGNNIYLDPDGPAGGTPYHSTFRSKANALGSGVTKHEIVDNGGGNFVLEIEGTLETDGVVHYYSGGIFPFAFFLNLQGVDPTIHFKGQLCLEATTNQTLYWKGETVFWLGDGPIPFEPSCPTSSEGEGEGETEGEGSVEGELEGESSEGEGSVEGEPQLVVVPWVLGDAREDAIALLEGLGFQVSVIFQCSSTFPPDIVTQQSPAGGVEKPYGYQIEIWISTTGSCE